MSNKRKPWMNWMLFFASLAIVFLLGLLVSSITERKMEAKFAYTPMTKINKLENDNLLLKEHLKKYTAPKRNKKFYENHKEEIIKKVIKTS